MTIRTYPSPEAFKAALEQRLRTSAKSGAEFARKRHLLVFECRGARFRHPSAEWPPHGVPDSASPSAYFGVLGPVLRWSNLPA